ncbi:3-phosphoshikimate 1-carboxyvinyltransferase [Natronospira bacteriovora]|uniref:3-phosphoshikimate 1-carboxyvinyltransferase n=1 Tax=Natronospira bacteriovora TaxID=3069753 RepID=A0ABU0W5D7_9GAMM|nr:3-phosphoshikimate 1-carboxyvinyltransferase [Natronospira sp. AB-CW4]MDQ2069182.1 3-phosphoshikimate 1-carboxyvinyltransferase [Natronospira sp. AB-CW4]
MDAAPFLPEGGEPVLSVPGDKSISHRALMFLAVSAAGGRIDGLLESADCLATLQALRTLGAEIRALGHGAYQVSGGGLRNPSTPLDLGNSGTGLRLLAGLLAGQGIAAVLDGDASLRGRPMGRIVTPLRTMGAVIEDSEGCPPLRLHGGGRLQGIDYTLPVASAQVKSAILLAGLNADGDTVVREQAPSRDHTERMLAGLGADIEFGEGRVRLRPGALRGGDVAVPGDLSSAAFFLAAAAASPGRRLCLRAVGINPSRDGILRLLRRMGAAIRLENERLAGGEPVADIHVLGSRLSGIQVGAEDVALAIDEIPALMIAATAAQGETVIRGAEELRVKESDRITALCEGLQGLGCAVEEWPDGLRLSGPPRHGARIDSHGDHRIAMSFALLAGQLPDGQSIIIEDVDNVSTSFPNFVEKADQIGVRIKEL